MLDYILLLAPATTEGAVEGAAQGSSWSLWVMMLLIFAVMYFLMIRPQQKRQKELQKQRDALTKGSKVVTAGGIYGIVKEVQESTFLIEVSKDVTLKVDKGSVYVAAEDAQQAPKA